MNFKASHLLRAVCAVAALSAFSGTASADCVEIQNFIKNYADRVGSALYAHYGDAQKRVPIESFLNRYNFLALKGNPSVEWVKGCTVRVKLPVYKGDIHSSRKQHGFVSVQIGFAEQWGVGLVILNQELRTADFEGQGHTVERDFIVRNQYTSFFWGSLICPPVDAWTCSPAGTLPDLPRPSPSP